MALVKCPECNNDVSSAADACPHCGFPLQEVQSASHIVEVKHPALPKEIRIDSVRCYDGSRPGSTVFGSKVGSVFCAAKEGYLAFLSSGKSGFLSKLAFGNIGGLLMMDRQSGKLDISAVEKEGGFIAPFSNIIAVEAKSKGILGMSRYLYVKYRNQTGSILEKSMITTSGLGGGDFEKVQTAFQNAKKANPPRSQN